MTKAALHALYGPFPSRAVAERYLDESLNLFLLRRCIPDLHPDPTFPGCVYSEMKMCLAPCFQGLHGRAVCGRGGTGTGVSGFARAEPARTGWRSEREQASAELEFEKAAAVHARLQKVEGVAALASEAVHPIAKLRAMVVQPAAEPFHVALFCCTGVC